MVSSQSLMFPPRLVPDYRSNACMYNQLIISLYRRSPKFLTRRSVRDQLAFAERSFLYHRKKYGHQNQDVYS
jgi:hypothetical protein